MSSAIMKGFFAGVIREARAQQGISPDIGTRAL